MRRDAVTDAYVRGLRPGSITDVVTPGHRQTRSSSPQELDRHRIALQAARQQRLDVIARSTGRLMARLGEAAERANSRVLFNPSQSPDVVRSGNDVAAAIGELDSRLGIDRARDDLVTRRWAEAATDARDRLLESGAGGVDAIKRRSEKGIRQAREVRGKVSDRLAERRSSRRQSDEDEGPGQT